MTPRRPYWCFKTLKQRPCWCAKKILWRFHSFPTWCLTFSYKNNLVVGRRSWVQGRGSSAGYQVVGSVERQKGEGLKEKEVPQGSGVRPQTFLATGGGVG